MRIACLRLDSRYNISMLDSNHINYYYYYNKAFIPSHSSGLKTCSEALTRHSVDKSKHKNK